MIVLPAPPASAAALASYVRLRALACLSSPMEAAVARGMADHLAAENQIVEVRLEAHVPAIGRAAVAQDGLTILVDGAPWWRALLGLGLVITIGGWEDPGFDVGGVEAPWEIAESLDDYELHLVGVASVVGQVRVLYAAASVALAAAELRRVAGAERALHALLSGRWWTRDSPSYAQLLPPARARLVYLLAGAAGAIDTAHAIGVSRRNAAGAARAIVRWEPSKETWAPAEGEIDAHAPHAHSPKPPPEPAVATREQQRARDEQPALWAAGYEIGRHAVWSVMKYGEISARRSA